MAIDSTSEVGSRSSTVAVKPVRSGKWAKLEAEAAALLNRSAQAIEAGPTGVPSDDVLRASGYVIDPGERHKRDRISQPLGHQDLSLTPAPAVNKK